jgi:hypothetical protein
MRFERVRIPLPLIVVETDSPRRTMYRAICEMCGEVAVHPTRTGAESRADQHATETGHISHIGPLNE